MRNHIIFKFLAILLCAATLLCVVGSAMGIWAMAELDLYQRSIDDAYAEYVENQGVNLAGEIAVRYASMNLGGCNSQLADSYYGNYWSYENFNWNYLGYRLLDEEGNELVNDALYEAYPAEHIFTYTPAGEYIRVLNTMTEEEYLASTEGTTVTESGLTVYNAVPEAGCDVFSMLIRYDDGGCWIVDIGEQIGQLFYDTDGSVEFESYVDLGGEPHDGWPVYIAFTDAADRVVYEASGTTSVYDTYAYQKQVTNIGLRPVPESTGAETLLYNAIPEGGMQVSRISVSYADGYSESAGGAPDIGYLGYDDSDGKYVIFTTSAGVMEYREDAITHVAFYDEYENLVYEASNAEGVGCFYLDGDQLIFRAWDVAESSAEGTAASEDSIYVYDDVPPQGSTVYQIELWLENGSSMYTVSGGNSSIGYTDHDAFGNVTFRAANWKDFAFSKPANVVYLCLTDYDGRVLYETYTQGDAIGRGGVIGTFAYDDEDQLTFTHVRSSSVSRKAADDTAALTPTEEGASAAATEAVADKADEAAVTYLAEEKVDVYASPAESSFVVGTVEAGETVEISMQQGVNRIVWGKVDGGWIRMDQLTQVGEDTAEATAPEEETVPATAAAEADAAEPAAVSETQVPEAPEAPTAPEAPEAPTAPGDTPEETIIVVTEPADAEAVSTYTYYDFVAGERMVVEYTYEELPAYTVEITFAAGALEYEYEWTLLRMVYSLQEELVMILLVSLAVCVILAVYLCCAAGRKPGTATVHAGGLNCLPLDLYAGLAAGGVALCAVAGVYGTQYLLRSDIMIAWYFAIAMGFLASLLIVGFCFAFVAQIKTPGGYWWRNSLCGWCLRLIGKCFRLFGKGCKWVAAEWDSRLAPMLVKCVKGLWKVVATCWGLVVRVVVWLVGMLKKGIQWLGTQLNLLFSMLPLIWQWLLVGFGMLLLMAMVIATNGEEVLVVICIGACIGIIIYGAHCFGVLLNAAKRMSKGDLDEKVEDKFLTGAFKDFAGELNSLADVAVVAAQKQLKSERMKTELITNVSHDIKTPLTSIINYVDLLQKPHTDEEQAVYLEVLDRQSQRLKKLIDDLMEMSKASTGNLTVDIQKVNAAEAINQALGEFADKLDKAQLTPVFRQPEKPIEMMADGRLVWRVMSNLLGNAVKYALPGTRVYLDLMEVDGKVIISMKNISREELNVNADELLERFVRGDTSRNTEGSGLGLNIAQSLMQLQKGQLQLLVDGDLFKVTLIFTGA